MPNFISLLAISWSGSFANSDAVQSAIDVMFNRATRSPKDAEKKRLFSDFGKSDVLI
jgi:hypothetical protein